MRTSKDTNSISRDRFFLPEKLGLSAAALLAAAVFLFIPAFETRVIRLPFKEPEARILFLGDLMFDRTIRTAAEARGYDFLVELLLGIFRDHDLIVGNLEGPITSHASVSVGSRVGEPENTRFTFAPEVAGFLAEHRMVAHLGNNHIDDLGPEGIEETRKLLAASGAAFFGDVGAGESWLITDAGGTTVALLSLNRFIEGGEPRVRAAIPFLNSRADIVIVYAHWGEEYVSEPTDTDRRLAHDLIDAGADLVVGSHPHVVQIHETYRGAPIYYSLGNAVFDQYWEDSVRCGAALSVTFRGGEVADAKLIPIFLADDRRTTPYGCTLQDS